MAPASGRIRRMRNMLTPRLASARDYHERSLDWARIGQWKAARADAERASRERPHNPFWSFTLGDIAYQAGDDRAAIAAYEHTVKLVPTDVIAVNSLAWALLMAAPPNRDSARALELARRVHAVDPRNGIANNTLALALVRLHHDAEAVAVIGKSVQGSPWDDLVLAPAYSRLGQATRARDALASALRWRSLPASGSPPREAADFRVLIEEAEAARSGRSPPTCLAPDR